ncbi:MAG: hypothetical protein K6F03_08785 [Saccharofermentans sp.]|nr:hypothetical protein [Saccharofermentans sp.]
MAKQAFVTKSTDKNEVFAILDGSLNCWQRSMSKKLPPKNVFWHILSVVCKNGLKGAGPLTAAVNMF